MKTLVKVTMSLMTFMGHITLPTDGNSLYNSSMAGTAAANRKKLKMQFKVSK